MEYFRHRNADVLAPLKEGGYSVESAYMILRSSPESAKEVTSALERLPGSPESVASSLLRNYAQVLDRYHDAIELYKRGDKQGAREYTVLADDLAVLAFLTGRKNKQVRTVLDANESLYVDGETWREQLLDAVAQGRVDCQPPADAMLLDASQMFSSWQDSNEVVSLRARMKLRRPTVREASALTAAALGVGGLMTPAAAAELPEQRPVDTPEVVFEAVNYSSDIAPMQVTEGDERAVASDVVSQAEHASDTVASEGVDEVSQFAEPTPIPDAEPTAEEEVAPIDEVSEGAPDEAAEEGSYASEDKGAEGANARPDGSPFHVVDSPAPVEGVSEQEQLISSTDTDAAGDEATLSLNDAEVEDTAVVTPEQDVAATIDVDAHEDVEEQRQSVSESIFAVVELPQEEHEVMTEGEVDEIDTPTDQASPFAVVEAPEPIEEPVSEQPTEEARGAASPFAVVELPDESAEIAPNAVEESLAGSGAVELSPFPERIPAVEPSPEPVRPAPAAPEQPRPRIEREQRNGWYWPVPAHVDAEPDYPGHLGTDYRSQAGEPITAIRDGIVVGVGIDPTMNAAMCSRLTDSLVPPYGDGVGLTMLDDQYYVEIEHPDGVGGVKRSKYVHVTAEGIKVKVNDKVYGGQVIAETGNTGCSTGDHLHLSLFDANGQVVSATQPRILGHRGY